MPAPAWDTRTLTGLPVLQLHPTLRCNLTCTHCYSSSGPTARTELGLDTVLRLVDDAAALGYGQLSVSGGEPLLYDALPALLARARRRGLVTSLVTNGLLLTTRRWDDVRRLTDVVAVSVDGAEREHDLVRGRQGAYRRTVAGLAALHARGTAYALTTTLTRSNADGLESVVRLAARHGAAAVQVQPLVAIGRAAGSSLDHRPDAVELLAALAEARWLGERLGVPVHLDAVSHEQLRRGRARFVPPPGSGLNRLSTTLVVAADGTVRPLAWDVDPSLWLGSLHVAPLDELAGAWASSPAPGRLRGACATAWDRLAARPEEAMTYWYDAVAEATRGRDDPAAGRISGTPAAS